MREAIHRTMAMVTTSSTIENPIANGVGLPTTMRVYMISGVQNGKNEKAFASMVSGFVTMVKMTTEHAIKGSIRKMFICCNSCSELVMAPSAAATLEYNR